MTTPLFELEGTWEEIAAQIPDFASRKLRVLVYPAEEHSTAAHDTRPITEVLAEIAATIPPAELAKSSTTRRAGSLMKAPRGGHRSHERV